MQENYSEFKVPSFAKPEAYNYEAITSDSKSVFDELNAISEEIEKCRLKNC
ncbi:hypothetical protein IKG38_04185 [Candidatus Saccharibacteria bacterium]|nr:hypothetical protein [Candidatus Saccharibacteria bacterium]MBR3256653.1 hypothetical protein [Candidatus Saccharibacteria bacterium]MBR4329345.1 hypothetical protein [Candidatus Riflebacteria bacterium]